MASLEPSDQLETLLGGIPQSANALGEPSAAVMLEYFGDLECPFCRDFSLEVLPSVIQRWVRPGELRIEYHALQTATREPEVFVAQQVAALAAGKQDRAWQFIEMFYEQQGEEGSGYVTDAYLEGIASQLSGLNLAQWTADRGDRALLAEIDADEQEAERSGLNGTPSFLLGTTGGELRKFSPSDPGSFDANVEALLHT
jgi:protein-disulfide isomerase